MAESAGPANQSGIAYQNLIGARFVAEMLSEVELPASRQIQSVTIEARESVDDVVVAYADGHKLFIQAKENLTTSQDAWRNLWADFVAQFYRPSFRRYADGNSEATYQGNRDVLCLMIGGDSQNFAHWGEALERTRGIQNFQTWLEVLTVEQRTFWQNRVLPLLRELPETELWQLLGSLRCEIHTRPTTEAEALRLLPSAQNQNGPILPTNLFSHITSRLPEDASRRVELSAGELKNWLLENHQVTLNAVPAISILREAVKRCSAVLRTQRNLFGEGVTAKRHIVRPIVNEIVSWLSAEASNKNIAALIDGPGLGKTVVLRDVLEALEADGLTVLAIKADLQLSDLRIGRLLHECESVRLPAPVEDVVGWLARSQADGKPVVVLLDQVDALSLTMARDDYAIGVISGLVSRLNGMKGVRVLLACRKFDLKTTPALHSLEIEQKFSLPELEEKEVKDVLQDAGIESAHLTPATRKLLRVPLHLDLFLRAVESRDEQGIMLPLPGDSHVARSLQDLYLLLWNRIVASPNAPIPVNVRVDTIRALVEAMNDAQQTSVPHSLFQNSENDLRLQAAEFFEREGLLQSERGNWSFLHQTFFDYAFARFFVEDHRSLSQKVLNSNSLQGLEERPLIKHVLGYLRASNPEAYQVELEQFGIATFFDLPDLRKHLRHLLREWFGALREPSDIEWRHARRLLRNPKLRNEFLLEASNNSDWFSLLLPEHFPHWLEQIDRANPDDTTAIQLEKAVFWMMRMVCNEPQAQSQMVALLQPYLDKNDKWNLRLQGWIFHVSKWHSYEAAKLYEELLVRFWDGDGLFHYRLNDIAKQRPIDACLIVGRTLDTILPRVKESLAARNRPIYNHYDVFTEFFGTKSGGVKIDNSTLDPLTENVPHQFLEAIWEFFIGIIARDVTERGREAFRFSSDAFRDFGEIRNSRGVMHRHHFGLALVSAVQKALKKLAEEQPTEFEIWFERLSALDSQTTQFLLIDALRSQPERYATLALSFLLSDERRLELGHSQSETRHLIRDIAPFWNPAECLRLEKLILNHWELPHQIQKGYKDLSVLRWRGYEQWGLLLALGKERLSREGQGRLREWNDKFRGYKLADNPVLSEGGFIGSPIRQAQAMRMSDRDWLAAMGHYQRGVQHREFLRGGAEQLRHVLQGYATEQPERFARLFLEQVPLDVDAFYVEGVLTGLSESTAPSELLFGVVRRFLNHSGPDVFKSLPITIARALSKRANDGLPDDLLLLMQQWVQSPPLAEDETFYARQQEEESMPAVEPNGELDGSQS